MPPGTSTGIGFVVTNYKRFDWAEYSKLREECGKLRAASEKSEIRSKIETGCFRTDGSGRENEAAPEIQRGVSDTVCPNHKRF